MSEQPSLESAYRLVATCAQEIRDLIHGSFTAGESKSTRDRLAKSLRRAADYLDGDG